MRKFWSLDWFKSEKDVELQELKIKTQKPRNEILEQDLEKKTAVKVEGIQNKPFKNVKLVNNVLTVVLLDGSIISKPKATAEDFEKVRMVSTEKDIYSIVFKEQEAYDKVMKTVESFDILGDYKDFEVDGRTVKLKGTGRTLPALLVEKFADIIIELEEKRTSDIIDFEELLQESEEYIALKRFFLWCCLNPRAEVADRLYDYLTRNNMQITKQGFFVGLRNVSEVEGADKELVDFITNSYHKIKAVWKKKPSDYHVWKHPEDGYSFNRNNEKEGYGDGYIDNLEKLYLNLPEMVENRFTDGWTKTFDIRIGKVVSMNPEDCNWSTQDCATAGLHFAGHTSPYVLLGDTTVFTLHNPMKVVGIGSEKGRCYEYLPFMTTTVDEADSIMNSRDFDFLQLDEQYAINELEGLQEKVKSGFAVEAKKYEFNLPQISSKEIANIVSSLEDMKETISKRVSNID